MMGGKMRRVPMVVFHYPGQVTTQHVLRSQVFVVFGSDGSVGVYDPADSGTYQIDVTAIAPDAKFPVAFLVVPRKHSAAFRGLKPEAIRDMLASTSAAFRKSLQ